MARKHRGISSQASKAATAPSVLVANRGEIAVRVIRAAQELGLRTVAVYDADDEARALHVQIADEAMSCDYMDADALVDAAARSGATLVHPGYGFLSEQPAFASKLSKAGVKFIGPSADLLELFGNKLEARKLAKSCKVPVLPGSDELLRTAQEVAACMREANLSFPVMLKDPWGGGGRGIVRVDKEEDLGRAVEQMAQTVDDGGGFLVETCWTDVQHIEVQILGDGRQVVHLGDRDCSIQSRRNQKVVEIAPAFTVPEDLRSRLAEDARRIASHVSYEGAGTVEFLVKGHDHIFLEVNPRVQVEHTVSEEVTGVDIVQAQLRIAQRESLRDLGIDGQESVRIQGFAIQGRVCLDTETADPSWALGALFEPTGPGVRIDSSLQEGVTPGLRFDPLVSKVVCRAGTWPSTVARFQRAMRDFATQNLSTNAALLRAIASHSDFAAGKRMPTTFLADHEDELLARAADLGDRTLAHALALSDRGGPQDANVADPPRAPEGVAVVEAAFPASVSAVHVEEGAEVSEGDAICTVTAMKMDSVLRAPTKGTLEALHVRKGTLLANAGDCVAWIRPASDAEAGAGASTKNAARAELEAEQERANELREDILRARERAAGMGGADNVKRHHERGRLTIRERIDAMLDAGTFREIGRAAPGNFVLGTGQVNERPVVVGGEDFTISGGSPTFAGLRKSVYTETLALELRVPLIRLHEGGGGSVAGAGGKGKSNGGGDDDDTIKPTGDAVYNRPRFESVRKVLDTVPVACAALGPVAGLPASRLVASHFSVMTENAQVLIAGPQVVQRALGYETTKEKLGGPEVHLRSGVVDNLASSEEDAFAQIARFLSYLPTSVGQVPPVDEGAQDPRDRQDDELLTAVSALHRRQVYDMRCDVMERVVDRGTLFEMTPHFGPGIITALARIAGRPVGIIANDCKFHGGAMTADGARKTKRFMETCEQFSLPIVFFVDEPGFMIGEEAESQATIRAGTEAVLRGASLTVPSASVVVRKAYGVAGAAHFGPEGRTYIWPTAEVGALPVESGVAVAFKRMLDAIEDEEEREKRRKELEDQFSARLSPMSRAVGFAAHDIIAPTETRPVLADWLDLAWPLVERHAEAKRARTLLANL